MMTSEEMYEQRLCAFVDILGFRDLVKRSVKHPALQGRIQQPLRKFVSELPVWERDNPTDIIEARLKQQGISDSKSKAESLVDKYVATECCLNFSDSLVFSATLNDHAITTIVTSLLFLSIRLAEIGKYARATGCLGPLCHEKDLCFGPALIAAYDLERWIAFYPRIVVSTEAHTEIERVNSPSVGSLSPYLREDHDGVQFFHFLGREALDLCGAFRSEQMVEIRRELSRQLSSSHTEIRVRPKLIWLARYFKSTLEEAPIAGVNRIPVHPN